MNSEAKILYKICTRSRRNYNSHSYILVIIWWFICSHSQPVSIKCLYLFECCCGSDEGEKPAYILFTSFGFHAHNLIWLVASIYLHEPSIQIHQHENAAYGKTLIRSQRRKVFIFIFIVPEYQILNKLSIHFVYVLKTPLYI